MIRHRGGEDVALIAADELRSLQETAHLLRPPKNAERDPGLVPPPFPDVQGTPVALEISCHGAAGRG